MIRRRRLRATANMRALVSETSVSVSDLIYPLFVIEGENIKKSDRFHAGDLPVFHRPAG